MSCECERPEPIQIAKTVIICQDCGCPVAMADFICFPLYLSPRTSDELSGRPQRHSFGSAFAGSRRSVE